MIALIPYIFFGLIFLYLVTIVTNFVLVYKILKSEGMTLSFFEYFITARFMSFKFFRVLFGWEKISNRSYLRALRINCIFATIIFLLYVITLRYLASLPLPEG